MQVIKCYEVMGHTDTTEGRGPMKVVARFSSQIEASRFVLSNEYSKWCVMGHQDSLNDLRKIHETTLIILDSVEEMSQQKTEQLRASALAKLTVEERAALGI